MSEPAFRFVRKGYEPSEVHAAVTRLRSEVDRLTGELGRAHDETAGLSVEKTKAQKHIADLKGRIKMLEETLSEVRAEKESNIAPSYESLGARIGQILMLAQAEADDLRQAAKADIKGLLGDARRQAEEVLVRAEQEASESRSKAELDAARILEDAKQRADVLLEEANGSANARMEEAEAVYEAQRAQAAQASADFERTLAERREEAMRELNETLAKKNQEVELADAQRMSVHPRGR